MKKYFIYGLTWLLMLPSVNAQEFAKWEKNKLSLDNGKVNREIIVENGSIHTNILRVSEDKMNFDNGTSKEFSFLIDHKSYDGGSGWQLGSFIGSKDNYHGEGATIKLNGTNELKGINLEITYLMYPDLPVIRKQITILNNSGKEIMLESFDVEKLVFGFDGVSAVEYTNYGRQKHLGTYIGNWDDPVLAIHSYENNVGLILGNEAPVLKRIDCFTRSTDANIGLTHTDDIYPFRKYIKAGEQWTSPRTFVMPYVNTSDPWQVMNTSLEDFERNNMGLRFFGLKKRSIISSNTWNPFRREFNDSLITDVCKAASECGIQLYTIDDGWFRNAGNPGNDQSWNYNLGDWTPDKNKFPNGLKPVFDKTKKMGLESGLWIALASVSKTGSQVFQQHPEWAVRDTNGEPQNLHSSGNKYVVTMCFGTDWKDYIKNKIINLVKELNLSYVKLDLSILTSAYVSDFNHSGCSATDHPYHKDRRESFIVIYERLFELFDEIHKEVPDLFIDCTFETEGKLQLMDYAFSEHAEGNWLTNVEEPYPVGAYRIRDLTWWKSPAVPASALLIGNLKIDSPDFIEELKSLIGSYPIVLGDPRNLTIDKRAEIKRWTNWLKNMQMKYNYDLFRQDLPGFGEPAEGSWDGWSRINTDTKEGGIIGIFRQGSLDEDRTVSVARLEEKKLYRIKEAPDNTEVLRITGKDLFEKGFKVKMTRKYDSRLFEVELIK
jgi:alpha-galactosidase